MKSFRFFFVYGLVYYLVGLLLVAGVAQGLTGDELAVGNAFCYTAGYALYE